MSLIALVLLPLGLVWLLPLCADGWSLLRRLLSGGRRKGLTVAVVPVPPSLAFLVPAHDEALLIEAAVRSLVNQRGEHSASQTYVVADNCSDDTAAIARKTGAIVLERHDPARPGKPAAIAWAMQQIPLQAFDAMVIVDADTVVDPAFADALAARGLLRDKAVQAYFGQSNPGDSWLTRLAGLLEDVRYRGQFPLKRAVGLNVPLAGNGMCLGRELLARHGWVTDSLTEDLELYAQYTAAGVEVDFAPDAILRAQEARDLSQTRTQRRRWQAGRLDVLRRHARPILTSRQIGLLQKLDALAELAFPGPVVHASIALVVVLLLGTQTGSLARFVSQLFMVSVLPTACWTVWALARRPDRGRLLLDMLYLPLYAVWRLWTGFSSVLSGPGTRWERSPRHPA